MNSLPLWHRDNTNNDTSKKIKSRKARADPYLITRYIKSIHIGNMNSNCISMLFYVILVADLCKEKNLLLFFVRNYFEWLRPGTINKQLCKTLLQKHCFSNMIPSFHYTTNIDCVSTFCFPREAKMFLTNSLAFALRFFVRKTTLSITRLNISCDHASK